VFDIELSHLPNAPRSFLLALGAFLLLMQAFLAVE
jgi:hypothetical protein